VPFRFRRSIRIAPGIRLNVVRWGLFRFRCRIRLAPGIRWNIGQWGLLRFRRSFRVAPGVRLTIGRPGPFRFRHSIRLAPGIRLNIGKRGLSTSLGRRVARVTAGRNTRATVSVPGTSLSSATRHRRSVNVVTVVIWGGQLLGAAAMMALLFLWASGWLPLQASAPEAEGGRARARGAGDRHSADLADTHRRRSAMTSQTAAPSPANADRPTEPAPAAKSAIVTTTSRKQARTGAAGVGAAPGVGVGAPGVGVAPANRGGPVNRASVR
jgi:Protein of unknown function (DUF4236)